MNPVENKTKIQSRLSVFSIFFVLISFGAAVGRNIDLRKLYMDANFSLIRDHFKTQDYTNLSLEEKLLFVECLARTAQGNQAREKMDTILADHPHTSEVLATAGILYFSQGRIKKAKEFFDRYRYN